MLESFRALVLFSHCFCLFMQHLSILFSLVLSHLECVSASFRADSYFLYPIGLFASQVFCLVCCLFCVFLLCRAAFPHPFLQSIPRPAQRKIHTFSLARCDARLRPFHFLCIIVVYSSLFDSLLPFSPKRSRAPTRFSARILPKKMHSYLVFGAFVLRVFPTSSTNRPWNFAILRCIILPFSNIIRKCEHILSKLSGRMTA